MKEDAYQEGLSPEFMVMADVYLVVEGKTFHAHSQLLAAQSGLLLRMLQDIAMPPSPKQPWVLESPFHRYSRAIVERFLSAVYRPPSFSFNVNEAWEILDIADCLDCKQMLKAGRDLLESQRGRLSVHQAVLWICLS